MSEDEPAHSTLAGRAALTEERSAGAPISRRCVPTPPASVLVKVGGSILAREDGSLDDALAESLAAQAATLGRPLLLVHGSGALGRAVLRRHAVESDLMTDAGRGCVEDFRRAVSGLATALTRVLARAGIRCHHLPSHQIIDAEMGQLNLHGIEVLTTFLAKTPCLVLHGDFLDDVGGRHYCCSGDEIVAVLAKHLQPRSVVFLTNVDGVFARFPPRSPTEQPLALVDKNTLALLTAPYHVGRPDMAGKVRSAIASARHAEECYIVNGRTRDVLTRLLLVRERIGTRVFP